MASRVELNYICERTKMAKRLQREIEEILQRFDDAHVDEEAAQPSINNVLPSNAVDQMSFWRRAAAVPLGRVMTWSLLLVIAAFFLRELPGMGWIMLGALIVFVVALSLRLAAPSDSASGPGWLNQPNEEWAPGWLHGIKSWIQAVKKL